MKLKLRKIGNIKHNKQFSFYLTLNKVLCNAILRHELKKLYV